MIISVWLQSKINLKNQLMLFLLITSGSSKFKFVRRQILSIAIFIARVIGAIL